MSNKLFTSIFNNFEAFVEDYLDFILKSAEAVLVLLAFFLLRSSFVYLDNIFPPTWIADIVYDLLVIVVALFVAFKVIFIFKQHLSPSKHKKKLELFLFLLHLGLFFIFFTSLITNSVRVSLIDRSYSKEILKTNFEIQRDLQGVKDKINTL